MMAERLFEEAHEYDGMLEQGLRVSGEGKEYFFEGRIMDLMRRSSLPPKPRILDFGCGTGEATAFLARALPGSLVTGVDRSLAAIELARSRHQSRRIVFADIEEIAAGEQFDLCYCNGVFHHIPVAQRQEAVAWVHARLQPEGTFAFFENNPWNPGTRWVMSRIPFDRDAVTLSFLESKRLLKAGGFDAGPARFLFYFPRPLSWLRPLEAMLVYLPGGAQYWYAARKTSGE